MQVVISPEHDTSLEYSRHSFRKRGEITATGPIPLVPHTNNAVLFVFATLCACGLFCRSRLVCVALHDFVTAPWLIVLGASAQKVAHTYTCVYT